MNYITLVGAAHRIRHCRLDTRSGGHQCRGNSSKSRKASNHIDRPGHSHPTPVRQSTGQLINKNVHKMQHVSSKSKTKHLNQLTFDVAPVSIIQKNTTVSFLCSPEAGQLFSI